MVAFFIGVIVGFDSLKPLVTITLEIMPLSSL